MDKDQFFALADGEALHFQNPSAIPWENPERAASFNELAHLIQYRWFREIIRSSPHQGEHLDMACGSGYGTALLSRASNVTRTTGADLNERHLAHARAHFPGIDFVQANAERLPEKFSPDTFAFVTSGQTIEHLLDPVSFISGVAYVLKETGVFALMSPTHNGGPLCLKPGNPWHVFEYDPTFLRDLLSFFFEEVRMGAERPAAFVFDDLKLVAGAHVNVPTADAVFCSGPKKIGPIATQDFRSRFLERFYRTIIEQEQARLVSARRDAHFLRESYHLFDIVSGVFNPEVGQMWTAPQAALRLNPMNDRGVAITFSTRASPEINRHVRFRWSTDERIFILNDQKPTVLEVAVTEPTILEIDVSPPFAPGGKDIRRLGISISKIAAA